MKTQRACCQTQIDQIHDQNCPIITGPHARSHAHGDLTTSTSTVYCKCGSSFTADVFEDAVDAHTRHAIARANDDTARYEPMSEVIHPPRGYCIGIFTGPQHGMIGPFATEEEARDALAHAEIVVIGQPPGWHEWCGATHAGLVCTKPQDHHHGDDPDTWHDNGSVAWPATVYVDQITDVRIESED